MLEKGVGMTTGSRVEKLCREFSTLSDYEKDYILKITCELARAIKARNISKSEKIPGKTKARKKP
jgi:hypothetical protein